MRISLHVRDGSVTAATFDAEGCAALTACAAAACEAVEGESVLGAASLGADEIAGLVGGLSPQGRHAAELAGDALGRALAPRRLRVIRSCPRPQSAIAYWSPCRGGVDSAVAALLERERGAEVVAVTLKLWADERTDGDAGLLLARGGPSAPAR